MPTTGKGDSPIHELATIEVTPDSEFDRLLDLATASPLRIVRHSARFRLERGPGEDQSDYDQERARAGMNAAGTWPDLDAADLKAYIARGREAGTRRFDQS